MTMPIPVNASIPQDDGEDKEQKNTAKDDGAVVGKGPRSIRRPFADINVTSTATRSPFTTNNSTTASTVAALKARQHPTLPSSTDTKSVNPTMQAIRLQKKYPEVTQEEMFDLINRFKYVLPNPQLRFYGY